MKLTKQQKILSGVMVAAVSALAYDQIVLGTRLTGPTEAYASTDADPSPSPITTTTGSTETEQDDQDDLDNLVSKALRNRAELYRQDQDLVQIRDLFNPSPQWVFNQPVKHIAPADNPADRFITTHSLTAIMHSRANTYAILNGSHIIHPGDQIDGFTLVSLGPRTAVFEADGTRVTLSFSSDI